MSMMCKMNGACEAKHGLCIHEKMMLAMVLFIVASLVGFWLFK
ncbi:MAG: hypothetical protein ACOY9D_05570 [Pseudomonadota bacterium]